MRLAVLKTFFDDLLINFLLFDNLLPMFDKLFKVIDNWSHILMGISLFQNFIRQKRGKNTNDHRCEKDVPFTYSFDSIDFHGILFEKVPCFLTHILRA